MTNFSNQDIRHGVLASLAGTTALSGIMVMKQMAGMVPEMNPIADLTGIAQELFGFSLSPLVGWLLHFALGAFIWGPLFAVTRLSIPGSNTSKGLIFAIGAWLLMMLLFMPMTGQGIFGSNVGIIIPVMSLMLHLVYGAVLGISYGKLSSR